MAGRNSQHRRTITLTGVEREALEHDGQVVVRRPVEWPHAHRTPFFAEAYVDPGGTELWGPGPYLKVPDQDARDGEKYVDRVFCPWGYPTWRLRLMRSKLSLTVASLGLAKSGVGDWEWVISLRIE
jgi:hypothetical protein